MSKTNIEEWKKLSVNFSWRSCNLTFVPFQLHFTLACDVSSYSDFPDEQTYTLAEQTVWVVRGNGNGKWSCRENWERELSLIMGMGLDENEKKSWEWEEMGIKILFLHTSSLQWRRRNTMHGLLTKQRTFLVAELTLIGHWSMSILYTLLYDIVKPCICSASSFKPKQ